VLKIGTRTAVATAALALGGLLAFFGCQKAPPPATARVEGIVTFQGRPLADGVVVFVPDADRTAGGKMFSASVDHDGRFVLADGAASIPPGWYKVAIADSPAGAGTYSEPFPPELRRPDRSGVEREVKAGQDHHFEFVIELNR